jgi:hypothetical protein
VNSIEAKRVFEGAAPVHPVSPHQANALGIAQREWLVLRPDVLEHERWLILGLILTAHGSIC